MPNTMPDKEYAIFPIGPLTSLPVLSNYDPNNWTHIPSGALIGHVSWDYANSGMGISSPWPANVLPMSLGQAVTDWITLCGFELKTIDLNTGEEVSTGYNILWQYKIRQAGSNQNRWYSVRVAKISITNPSDVTELATANGHIGETNYYDKWKYDGFVFGGIYTHNNKKWYLVGVGGAWERTIAQYRAFTANSIAICEDWFINARYVDPIFVTEDPNEGDNPPYGPGAGGEGGGNGRHNLPDENIPVPGLPTIGAASVSWLHLFKMSESDISAFGNDLVQATNWQAIQAYFSDPLDAIIGINLVPVDMPTSGQRTPVIGSFSWSRAFDVVSEEFYELDCGEVNIDPYWDSAFDMNPFTKIFIFLPFIGVRELNADEVMGTTVGVIYHVDVCTGDCTAFVTKKAQADPVYGPIKNQVIAQFNGNCAVRVPTGRISQDAAIGAAMSLLGQAAHVGGAIAGAAFGAPETIAAAQVATQVSSATMHAVEGGKTKVERSGSLAAAAGYMGILKPYIIRAIPQQVLPTNYQILEGYPANKAATLSQFAGSGLNTVEAIRLTGFTGYDSEQDELISILQGGVLV